MAMTHDQARHLVRRTQIVGAVVAFGAAALWAMDVPGLGPGIPDQDAPIVQPDAPISTTSDEASIRPRIDKGASLLIAQNLDLASRREKRDDLGPIRQPTEPTTPAVTGPAIRFLGVVEEPDRLVALISIDGKQRMLSEGRTSGDVKLVNINHERIIVTIGREERSVPLAERTGPSVAWVAPGAGGGPGGMGNSGLVSYNEANAAMNAAANMSPGVTGRPGGSDGRTISLGGGAQGPRPESMRQQPRGSTRRGAGSTGSTGLSAGQSVTQHSAPVQATESSVPPHED